MLQLVVWSLILIHQIVVLLLAHQLRVELIEPLCFLFAQLLKEVAVFNNIEDSWLILVDNKQAVELIHESDLCSC